MKLDVIASRGRHGTFSVIVVAAAIAIVIVAVARQPDPVKRALLLRRAGFTWMALFTVFSGAFIVGDTFTGPGGWRAAGLVAAWAVPLAGLAALAWYRPSWAIYVFAVLTVTVIGVSIWFAVNPQGWRSFEDQHGPIRAVITVVLVAAIAVLGLKRTTAAGVLLLIAGIVAVAVSSLGSLLGFASLSVVSSAPVITGSSTLPPRASLAGRHHRLTQPPGPRNGRRRRDHAG